MNKILVLTCLVVFILYSLVSLVIDIPMVFNNIFYGIISILGLFFAIFYLNIGEGLKERFKENKQRNIDEKKI
ncbi:hypothetical protein [Riemerella anatipestifer]|uniref:hypothetical protein n=1 Tax=Riemerella anatipestifer TaxID=34085 RepID=UPI00129DB5A6|nr:hypothetical protein [Riemerella anatipestifer]MDY3538174.1 hypothetical protein [Riemerella anatipestifer]MRM84281.1 hypothetical protein [Riemerella anatipestifer]